MVQNFKYKVFGRKLKKRKPITDYKSGEIIDDGQNLDILLTQSNDKWSSESFLNEIKKRFDKKEWKFWIIENE